MSIKTTGVSFRSKTGEFQISLEKLGVICSAKVSFGTLDATVSIGPSLCSVNGVVSVAEMECWFSYLIYWNL